MRPPRASSPAERLAGRQDVKGSLLHGAIRRVAVRAPAALGLLAFKGRKTYTALVRVRNEEQFLDACVRSIIDLVDEVVIVDNNSTDDSPRIISELRSQFPEKVRSATYPYELARYGAENRALAETREGRRSPQLLANFYNATTKLCSHPFVLKWDADTVATRAMTHALEAFRYSPAQSLWHVGANLHPDGTHLIAGRPFEEPEPRLFRRRFSHYNNGLGYCELLKSPFLEHEKYSDFHTDQPLYVHLKYYKENRFANMSSDLQRIAADDALRGQLAPVEVRETVARWSLRPDASASA